MAYEQVVPGQPLINSALWIIPRMVQGMGLQTVIRRQGKQHLSPMEQKYVKPVELITGFRPCQWLVGYEWSSNPANDALWLTASIRSAERRVGKECVSTSRSRWSPSHKKTKQNI